MKTITALLGRTTFFAWLFFMLPLWVNATPPSLGYQGRIVKADGQPLEYGSVSFLFQITTPNGSCVLYEEQLNGVNMVNSKGVFDVPIGSGTRLFPTSGSTTVLESFNNSALTLPCKGGGSFTPAVHNERILRVQFHDGVGWRQISPDNTIRSVPFAAYSLQASKVGDYRADQLLAKDIVPTCTTNTFLSWNGVTMTCEPVAASAGGTVTDVQSGSAYITVTNSTSTPTLTLNVGTAANTVAAGNDARFTNARVPTGSAGGDLSDNYPNPKVTGMQGVPISATAPSSGNFLKYNGTNWQGTTIAISDVISLTTSLNAKVNVSQFPASCAADQALTFSSPTGAFICASIAIAGSQVTGNIAGNAAGFTGALVGDVSGTQGATSVDKIKGVPVVMTGNGSGKVLTFNGTSWAPADPATSGTVTSVSSTNSYLSVAGTTTPALTLNVGAIANTVAAGNDTRIVNAIQNAGATVSIQSGLEAALPASSLNGKIFIATDTQKIYRDNGTAWVVIATATGGGGTVTSVGSGTGLSGGPITGSGTLAVDVGTTSGKILQLDGSARIPAVDGSLVTNLNPVNLSAAVPVNRGGTGQSSYTDGQILVGTSTGNTLVKQILTGDAAMTNAGLVTVNGVKGKSVSAAPTLTGQMLRYDGTNWTPNFVSMFDLRSTLTGAQAFGGVGCTSGQTLTWTAATDNLACTTISITTSQIASGTLPIANGGTGAATTSQAFVFAGPATGGAGAPAFRALASTDLPATVTNGLWTESSGNVYRTSGLVGIGTTSPSSGLTIQGDGSGIDDIRINSFTDTADWGAAFHIIRANGTSTLPTPVLANQYILRINTFGYDGTSNKKLAGIDFKSETDLSSSVNGRLEFITTAGNSPTTKMTITSAGNVGIGTTGPSERLHIAANGANSVALLESVKSTGGAPGLLMRSARGTLLSPTATQTNDNLFFLGGKGYGTNAYPTLSTVAIFGSAAENYTDSAQGSYLRFDTTAIGSNTRLERMRIDSSGNVGIGTTNPSANLEISAAAGTAPLVRLNTGGSTTKYSEVAQTSTGNQMSLSNVAEVGSSSLIDLNPRPADGTSDAWLRLLRTTNTTGARGLQIMKGNNTATVDTQISSGGNTFFNASGGNVGIGTSTPAEKLDVVGNIGIYSSDGNSAGFIQSTGEAGTANKLVINGNRGTGGVIIKTNNGNSMFINQAGNVGIGTTTPSDKLHVAGDIRVGTGTTGCVKDADGTVIGGTCSSDIRFKRDIASLDSKLDQIVRLRPVTYYWRADEFPAKQFGTAQETGLIAQEVQEQIPELVTKDEEGFLRIRFSEMNIYVLQALKEFYMRWFDDSKKLHQEIAVLKQQNSQKDQEIAEIRMHLKSLEKRLNSHRAVK